MEVLKGQKKLDTTFLPFKTKYFAYRFNDFQSSIGEPLIKIRHNTVTDNYLAAEEIQNQNWKYFIERTIEVCKSKGEIKSGEEFLLKTVENTTIAKNSHETFYNIAQKNLYLTVQKISVDEKNKITEDLTNKNFWYKHALIDLDSWIAFYYMFGRFPGAEKFTNVPNVNKQTFLQTEMPLSLLDLYKKFRATDAKGLVSLHGLAALNIHFGGNSDISKIALGEYFKNLTYQALSQKNDNIFLSFSHGASLIHSLLGYLKHLKQKKKMKLKIRKF